MNISTVEVRYNDSEGTREQGLLLSVLVIKGPTYILLLKNTNIYIGMCIHEYFLIL